MNIINSTIYRIMTKRFAQVQRFLDYPVEVQQNVFKELIDSGKNTEWGKKYHYSDIKTWNDFAKQVPINNYEDLLPYIERLMRGENYLLWNQKVRWFAKSSGTTGNTSKFIPITEDALRKCHYKGGYDMVAIYCNMFNDTHLFTGSNIALGGCKQNEPSTDIFCGDLSAILMDNLPFWAESFRYPRKSIALMSEWESKLKTLVSSTYNKKIVSLSGVPSWMLLFLQECLNFSGKSSVAEMWPYLEVYFTGGVHFLPYQEKFNQLIGDTNMRYINVYNASEGFFGVQDQSTSSDMLLLLNNGVFYEFIPTSELGTQNPSVVSLENVKIGVNYAMIISTNTGLWRYMIGDTVAFSSIKPYRIRITGRTKNFINVCGEELIVDNAVGAIKIACEALNCVVREFSAAPYFSESHNPIGHQWVIEFEKAPENANTFAELLDKTLQKLNSDYKAKRHKDMILKPLLLSIVPQGTFFEWQKANNRLGGQYKIPRLNNERKTIDPLLEIAKKIEQ